MELCVFVLSRLFFLKVFDYKVLMFTRQGYPFLVLSVLLLASPFTHAAHFVVSNSNDSGGGSLRAALLSANGNNEADTITFAAALQNATIFLTSDELQISSEVTLMGFSTASLSISGNSQRRVFDLTSDAVVTMADLTIRDGLSNSASGISNAGTLILNDCVLRNHIGGAGAAVRNFGGSLTMNDCLIVDNLSDDDAAVNSFGTGPNAINRCRFENNHADKNGGAFASFGPFTITDSTFEENYAGLNGAGLVNGNELDLVNCTFLNNEAVITGGAVDNRGNLDAINCTFSGNTAASGAAIAARFGVNLINCTIANNLASGLSGITTLSPQELVDGINGAENFATLSNISSVGTAGGLLTLAAGNFAISNTILADNTPQQVFAQSATTLVLNGNNLSSDNSFASVPNLINSSNLFANTDPLLGSLANNGGEVLTFALLPGSPAIDSGDNSIINNAPLPISRDARGVFRIIASLTPDGGVVDLGAFEFSGGVLVMPEVFLEITSNSSGQPLLLIEGTPGASYRVWSSETLDFDNGSLRQTLTLDGAGLASFLDTESALPSERFYRLEFVISPAG